jgi:hypothetical protein
MSVRSPVTYRCDAVMDCRRERARACLSTADEAAWAAGSWSAIPNTTLTASPAQLTEQLTAIAEQGITEIVNQPTGPDIPHELEAFINVARAVPAGSQVGRPGAGRP